MVVPELQADREDRGFAGCVIACVGHCGWWFQSVSVEDTECVADLHQSSFEAIVCLGAHHGDGVARCDDG
ncbi:hypothetical protein ACZ91_65000 [Streptomyces regensis]|nr:MULTISPECIES: hypothetical protein [Pseudonocardiaceae]KMS72011.1 hypothetical protein ACZ91_65000 [Streptomyces regensis]OLT40569.1 hypothetical protein BJF85_05160 [Saccharomonospora sp. CUA-673]